MTIVPNHVLTEIGPGLARGQNVWAPRPGRVGGRRGRARHRSANRTTSSTTSSRADPERLEQEEIEAVYRIGDCVAPRLIAECVFDGHRLAREIDSPDPRMPLPFLRELPDFQTVG